MNKSMYRNVFQGGRSITTISLSNVAKGLLLEHEIRNVSAYINDLIIKDLSDNETEKKKIFAQISELRDVLSHKFKTNTTFGFEKND